jgi:hypothetical protein
MPRIYVSTRYRSKNSKSTSDFVFQLRAGALEFNENATAIIDSVCISNCFHTVIQGHNTKVYVRFYDASGNTRVDKVVELSVGDKTITPLAAELQTKLQAAKPSTAPFAGTVAVNVVGNSRLSFEVTGLPITTTMELVTFDALRLGFLDFPWTGAGADALDFGDLQDACGVVGVNTDTAICAGPATVTCQHVSFQPYRTLYLHCSSEAESIGPRGENSIILSVVVGNTVRGDIITLNESYTASPVSLPSAVSELRFQLKDVNGATIDLEGHDMSFALITQ